MEGALLRLRRLNPFCRLLALSATMGNRAELANWLQGVHLGSDWRPIPIEWRVSRFRKATEKPGLMLGETRRCAEGGGQSLVFVQSRRRAEQLSAHLREGGLRAQHHHAGLRSEERRTAESGYRAREIDVLVSTGTLEMGVNLPARQVLLYDLQGFNGLDFVPLAVNTVWQRAGRAGRRGLDERGEVVLFAPSWERGVDRYLQGAFEDIRSHLGQPRALAEQVVAEVASGMSRTRGQLRRAFTQSLAQQQGSLLSLDGVIRDMLQSGMLSEAALPDKKGSRLRATRLGRIATRQMLNPATVLHLANALEGNGRETLSFLDLLLLAASTHDCAPRLPADFEELDSLAALLASERSSLLTGSNDQVSERLNLRGRRLLSVAKTALVARCWTRMADADTIAEEFGCYAFEVRRLVESLERVLTAAVAIATPPRSDEAEEEEPGGPIADEPSLLERLRALLAMVAYGIDEEAVTLTYLPGVGGTLARRLHAAGVTDIEELALCEPKELAAVRGISSARAGQWIERATETIRGRSAVSLRETGLRIQALSSDWPAGVDPYRLRRARELDVRRGGSRRYVVSGGLEPHRVAVTLEGPPRCDCADAAKGNECKHSLAVRLHRRDPVLKRLVERLQTQGPGEDTIDLFNLWFDGTTR